MNWKQLEDVLASHLYAIGALKKSEELIELQSIPRKFETTDKGEIEEYAYLNFTIGKSDNA